MSFPRFLIYLFLLVAILTGTVFGLEHYDVFKGGEELANTGIAIFTVINILFFLLAAYFSEKSDDKNYLNLVFLNFIIKLVVVLMIPLVYYEQHKPTTSNFVVSYIIVYVAFTIFETWFLSKNVKMRKQK